MRNSGRGFLRASITRHQAGCMTWICLAVTLGVVHSPLWAAVKAFPTAEGFGANAVGGRGGRVIEVTNLNDSGPGSLRACAEATGPRICVFRIGGTIALNSPISINGPNSYLTMAAQTAPGDGIQLKNWYVTIGSGAHDVIIRHLRFREGTDHTPQNINNDCGGFVLYGPNGGVSNVVLDHVSVEWVCDDSLNRPVA